MGVKGFEWVTQREKHQGRSRTNRDIIGCQTANQQFNWTGDFRIETPTNEMWENDRIYKCMYQGEYKVARKLTPFECLRLMGFEDFIQAEGVNDNNLYLNGNVANNTAGTFFAPADGNTALSSAPNTWGYYYNSNSFRYIYLCINITISIFYCSCAI